MGYVTFSQSEGTQSFINRSLCRFMQTHSVDGEGHGMSTIVAKCAKDLLHY